MLELIIGKFKIRDSHRPGYVWVERTGGEAAGEGAEFSKLEFEKVIEKFYKDNF